MSVGYLCYDLMFLIFALYESSKREDKFADFARHAEFLIHHTLTLTLLVYILINKFGGAEVCTIIIVYEISTPLISFRNILRDIGLKKHPFTLAMEILFYLAFFIARVCIGSYIVFGIIFERDGPRHTYHVVIKTFFCLLQLLQFHWFYLCTKLVARKIVVMSENDQKIN